MKTDSQSISILNDLYLGIRLTPMDAIKRYGCTKLSTRIGELITEGFKIEREPVTVKTRTGRKTRVMSYYMKP